MDYECDHQDDQQHLMPLDDAEARAEGYVNAEVMRRVIEHDNLW